MPKNGSQPHTLHVGVVLQVLEPLVSLSWSFMTQQSTALGLGDSNSLNGHHMCGMELVHLVFWIQKKENVSRARSAAILRWNDTGASYRTKFGPPNLPPGKEKQVFTVQKSNYCVPNHWRTAASTYCRRAKTGKMHGTARGSCSNMTYQLCLTVQCFWFNP